MTKQVDSLEETYRRAAHDYGAAAQLGNAKAKTKSLKKLISIGPKLRTGGKKGEGALRRLMRDPSDAVATWAARDSLPFAEQEALAVLDAIGKKTGPIAFDAEMVAETWRAGKLKI